MKQQPLTSSRAAPCRHVTHDSSSCSQLGDQISAHYHLCRWARPQPVRNNNNLKTADSERSDRPKTATLPRPSSNRTVGGFVAQFGLSSLCMRTPMAQAPDEWLTALQRWATHSCA